jgi:hypothetical protein
MIGKFRHADIRTLGTMLRSITFAPSPHSTLVEILQGADRFADVS